MSLYKTFAHCNMKGTTVEFMFLYHSRLGPERSRLRESNMRSTTGGALRPAARREAALGKSLGSHHASMKQQLGLMGMARDETRKYTRKRYFQRGELALMRLYAAERWSHEEFKRKASARKLVHLVATCTKGPSQRLRQAVPPPEAYMHLLNPLHAPGHAPSNKRKGTGYGNYSLKKRIGAHREAQKAEGPPPGKMEVGATNGRGGSRKLPKIINLSRAV